MASHVVVVDSTARRAMVKTSPGTYLSDVLEEACKKLGAQSSQFTLKYEVPSLRVRSGHILIKSADTTISRSTCQGQYALRVYLVEQNSISYKHPGLLRSYQSPCSCQSPRRTSGLRKSSRATPHCGKYCASLSQTGQQGQEKQMNPVTSISHKEEYPRWGVPAALAPAVSTTRRRF